MIQKAITPESIIEYRETKKLNQSIIDNRVRSLHETLCRQLKDDRYDVGHVYKIARRFSDDEIYKVSEYCLKKSYNPAHAFVAIFTKKLAQ